VQANWYATRLMPGRRNFNEGLTAARPETRAVAKTESLESWASLSLVPAMLDADVAVDWAKIHPRKERLSCRKGTREGLCDRIPRPRHLSVGRLTVVAQVGSGASGFSVGITPAIESAATCESLRT